MINHGVQLNWAEGPWSVSVAGTDGFFSGDITWFTGNVAYKIDDSNTIGVNGGVNLGSQNVLNRSLRYQFATPLNQQNSGIFNINYTYSNGPWIVTPYFQFTNVEADQRIGILQSASTYGGALLAAYSFTDNFALAGRVEYEEQSGVRGSGTTSLLYGAGSNAFSITVTPTFTFGPLLPAARIRPRRARRHHPRQPRQRHAGHRLRPRRQPDLAGPLHGRDRRHLLIAASPTPKRPGPWSGAFSFALRAARG